MPLKSYDKDAFHLYTNIWFSLLQTHSEVHEVEELFQHFCHDGEISFWQVVPHSSHIQLVDKDAVRKREREVHKIIKIRNQKTEHPIKMLSWYVLFVCVCDSQGSPDTGSPAAVLCRRPRCCPPCASLHAAELRRGGRRWWWWGGTNILVILFYNLQ